MRIARLAAGAIVVITLAACATVRVVHEAGEAAAVSTAPDARTVLVQPGDTLYGIASRRGLSVADLAAWNTLSAPYTIQPGQRLQLAPGTVTAAATPPISVQSSVTSSPRLESARSTASTITTSAIKSTEVAPTKASKWRWPADGSPVTRTSTTASGIDIIGRDGAPVRAVADGVVLYSGAGSPGYEELIVIRHDNDWLSSYAHNRKRLVGEGQRVRAGSQIAEMGRRGATRDQLYFEMRHDGALVDPLTVLPPR